MSPFQQTGAVFEHPAMRTTFRIRLAAPVPPDAHIAASACFEELERIEALLSRHRPDSDIARINALREGEHLYLHEDTHSLLGRCIELHAQTAGLFDIAIAGDHEDWCLAIDPNRPLVTCIHPGRLLDLGGIGKGFALDRLAAILREHGIHDALLSSGPSTHLASGEQAWEAELTGESLIRPVALRSRALSASGTGILGQHILAPGGVAPDAYPHRRVWVFASDAACADALSTACMLMPREELASFLCKNPQLEIHIETHECRIEQIGKLPDSLPG